MRCLRKDPEERYQPVRRHPDGDDGDDGGDGGDGQGDSGGGDGPIATGARGAPRSDFGAAGSPGDAGAGAPVCCRAERTTLLPATLARTVDERALLPGEPKFLWMGLAPGTQSVLATGDPGSDWGWNGIEDGATPIQVDRTRMRLSVGS